MPALKNARHEQFALMVAKGEPAARAYRQIYGKPRNADVLGSKLAKHPRVAARVAEIRRMVDSEGLETTLLTIREKRMFLAQIVRTPIGSLDDSSPLLQWVRYSKGCRAVAMLDKLAALKLDAQLAGELNPAEKPPNINGDKRAIIFNLPTIMATPRIPPRTLEV